VSWAAHELESYVIQKEFGKKWRVSYLAILLGCYIPDLITKIFVYGISVGPVRIPPPKHPWHYHRGWPGVGFTHSLLFGLLIAFFVLWKWRSREWFIGLCLGTAAHVITDTCDSIGTMLFFPFTTQHYSNGMWAYAAQQGQNGDGAAYYSSLGGIWDMFWLVIVLLNRDVLSRTYFFSKVVPDDPVWDWSRRKFRLSDAVMLAMYRSYFFYGACRIWAWFIWARWIQPRPLDLNWGGPFWVVKAPPYHWNWATFTINTVVGVLGLAATLAAIWYLAGRRWWDRARVLDPMTDRAVPA
jgi:membrane-bound metal-dependent hydrolase YbcI (DUF457 family)